MALRAWNKYLFLFELTLAVLVALASASTPFHSNPLVAWPLIVYAYSRCNEIAYAFYRDTSSRLSQEEQESDLTSTDRIHMAMKSYVGLAINFALLYFFIPIPGLFNQPFANFLESIYFSGVTLTTLGYGDMTPTHFFSRLLVLYEVFAGIFLVVVAIATYVGNPSRKDA
ncbi:MAG: hypothetical protein A3F90_09785 [Deltaproteobacteria bacterium RIFCSPLOWO2_12_FULL_60_19]|nr:MAG: hypothetical protein A3F90_09785 [Deltaproteobacteria bacterium RIFCSPLOWO2_12_FULL_60_19]